MASFNREVIAKGKLSGGKLVKGDRAKNKPVG